MDSCEFTTEYTVGVIKPKTYIGSEAHDVSKVHFDDFKNIELEKIARKNVILAWNNHVEPIRDKSQNFYNKKKGRRHAHSH